MILEFISLISLILPGLWVLQLAQVRLENNVERLCLSYILSLAMIFSLLYIGGIMKAFNVASFMVLAIVVASFVHLFVLSAIKVLRSPYPFDNLFFLRISPEKLIIIISTIGLLSIYAVFLSSKAILDSDVVHYYLPMAREIVRGNGFMYNTGYDYNVNLKPIGASVLYAWTYMISGSTLSEAFRLMPLVPILILIVLNYAIATSATKSQSVSIISTAVFLIIPFHDRFLLYTAFYPDVFYYPFIFIATYFLIEFFQSKRSSLLFWTGLGLGAASLLKTQAIYFLIAFILVFLLLELRSFKKLSAALCLFTPFYLLGPSILANSIQGNRILLSIPHFTGIQIGLFLFLSTLSVICYYVTIYGDDSRKKNDRSIIKVLVKKITLLILPFAVLSSLWYVNNLLNFGTIIWTTKINLPNFDWALGVLKSTKTTQPTPNIWHYLVYFIFIFADPAVMGYIILIPMLLGLLFVLRERMEKLNILLLFGIISASIILSRVAVAIYSSAPGYNPRDILTMAPLLSTLSSIGIVSVTSTFGKKSYDMKKTIVSFLMVAYIGLLNYVHSVYVWYIHFYPGTKIGESMSAFAYIVGLNLRQISFQLSYGDKAIFIGENILRIFLLSFIAGIPFLVLMIYRHYKLYPFRGYTINMKLEPRFKKSVLKLLSRSCSSSKWQFAKGVFMISLMLSVIIIPRVEMLIVQGGPQNIKENQLKRNYNCIYELFASPSEFEGDILTFKAPMGLPYYLPDVKIIDLTYPANLAFLKDCFQSNTPYEAVLMLREQNIGYVLIHPSITQHLDASLNFTLSKIIQNPEYASLSRTFGSWKLYILDPY